MKKRFKSLLVGMLLGVTAQVSYAEHLRLEIINADDAQMLLGDGTGVVIGFVDSGIDDTHPGLRGTDSQGLNRLVAEANFVTDEPANTGDDLGLHGTGVSSVALGYNPNLVGLGVNGIATDARYVNARVMDSSNEFDSQNWILNGAGFAVENGSDIINLSLNQFSGVANGNSKLSMMVDYLAYARNVSVVVAAGNTGGNVAHQPLVPADNFNVITVGGTLGEDYTQVYETSSWGPVSSGRSKPDLVAPGHDVVLASAIWEDNSDYFKFNGTSFAAPHVSGLLATQIEYGRENGMSTDVLVLKSTMMNSASKVNDREGNDWEPGLAVNNLGVQTVLQPLDTQSGAGQVDGLGLYEQYSAGEQGPGGVDAIGWDLNMIEGTGAVAYLIEDVLEVGTYLDMTLTWNRHVGMIDGNQNGMLDQSDSFELLEAMDNLDLELLLDGELVAKTVGGVDNVEHLHYLVEEEGDYVIRVLRHEVAGSGSGEMYGLAWYGSTVAIPEPGSLGILLVGGCGLLFGRRKRVVG